MTSLVTVEKHLAELKSQLTPKLEDVVTVVVWTVDGKDKPFKQGDRFRILALKEPEP